MRSWSTRTVRTPHCGSPGTRSPPCCASSARLLAPATRLLRLGAGDGTLRGRDRLGGIAEAHLSSRDLVAGLREPPLQLLDVVPQFVQPLGQRDLLSDQLIAFDLSSPDVGGGLLVPAPSRDQLAGAPAFGQLRAVPFGPGRVFGRALLVA